jgi:hypothetical protein
LASYRFASRVRRHCDGRRNRLFSSGHAADSDAASCNLEIANMGFHSVSSDREELVARVSCGLLDGETDGVGSLAATAHAGIRREFGICA